MKHIIILAFAIGMALTTTGQQSTPPFEYRPGFSAIIVSNVGASVEWYKKVFGLTATRQIMDETAGVRMVVLESSNLTLELLQINGSVGSKDLLQGKEGIEIQGLVKMGFYVPDVEACMKHLANLKIAVPHVWTDPDTKKKNFIIMDPDGNKIQFFQ